MHARIQQAITSVRRNKGKVVAVTALAFLAIGAGRTGAFFSDSHDGALKGTIGTIQIDATSGLNLTYENMLPGEPQTETITYENTGRAPQDVWLTFPNATALSALNDLGTYGEIHVVSNGTEIFASTNMNDHTNTCSAPECKPLPAKLKLASKVMPGETGTATITFNYASKMQTQPAEGAVAEFNVYPVTGQFTTNAADGSGTGLPLRLVATQVNQQP